MNTLTRRAELIYTDWTLTEPEFVGGASLKENPAKLRARETVFTIGNGYLGTRGSFEEGYPKALPITLINGVYDDIPVVYTELANCPDWLLLVVIINGEQFRLDRGEILSYERRLDLRDGVLSRSIRWRSPTGNTVDLKFDRFASLADEQVLALRCQITPIDFDCTIEVQSSINSYPENQGFDHWEHLDRGKTEQGVWLHVRTRSTQIELGMAAKMTTIDIDARSKVINTSDCPILTSTFVATVGQSINVEKVVAVFTSRETKSPVQAAQTKLATLPAYAILLAAHQQAWNAVWEYSDIEIEGDLTAQLAVRYNLFQLFIGGCTTQGSLDTDPDSVPAKTLSGFGYRGHIFWDTEIFILPFFTFTQPTIARNLLNYRYDTDILHENWNYYTPRTDITQGSSLGSSVQALLAASLDKSVDAYEHFMRAALIDLKDSFGNTADGIHAASAGGVWQAIVFGFGGIQLTENGPVAIPHLPPNWTRLKFKLSWRGAWHHFNLSASATPDRDIQGYIFDVDGVLTDTAEYHYRAWQRLADEEGLPFDRQANEALRGVSRRESLMHIVGIRLYSEAALQAMMERKNHYYVESIATITPKDLFPGAIELLTELRQAGIKIAIAKRCLEQVGSASKNARTVIEKLGIGDLVDSIADGDSVDRPKPAPDLFLYAANQIGIEPDRCVVVEDATVGIEAAIAAGMRSIGIGSINRVGAADIVLPNLIGVHPIDLQTQLKLALAKPIPPIETAKLPVASSP